MSKFSKKVLVSILVAVMCISSVHLEVFAQEVTNFENAENPVKATAETEEQSGNSIEEGSTEDTEGRLVLPDTVSGNDVGTTETTETETSETETTETKTAETETIEAETAETEIPEETSEEIAENIAWDGKITEKVYKVGECKITYLLSSHWESGYSARVRIENTDEKTIQNWALRLTGNVRIAEIWNAKIIVEEENNYIVKNTGWNQDIAPGKSIEFGISGNQPFSGFPEECELLGECTEVKEEDYSIEYCIDSDWEDGFYGYISIQNSSEQPLEDWVLEFDFDGEITEVWDAVIDSHEENHYVIRNAGYNANIFNGNVVSIGIQGRYCGESREFSDFRLYSYVPKGNDGIDRAIVENAYSKLAIGYAEGDDRNAVTSDIYLCTELEGAEIIWNSDNPEVISADGTVTRSGKTQMVRLTATIKSNDYSMDIDFDLRVVKNTYDGYNTDFIYDMDSLELLYLYNDDPNELEVYLNEEGYIDELNGRFSKIIVESPQEAILALYEIKSFMGCENPREQLVWKKTSADNYGYYYRFYQVVDGVPVYGKNIVISTDLAGNTTTLHSSFIANLDIDTNPTLTESDAKAIIEANGYSFLSSKGLVIYEKQEAHLAYHLECLKEGRGYGVLVDANTGELLFETPLTMSESEIKSNSVLIEIGNDIFGNPQTFRVNEMVNTSGEKTYTLNDPIRNIRYYDLTGYEDSSGWPGKEIAKETNTWTPEEISAVVNMEKVYDYYYTTLGRRGFDDNCGEFHMSINLGEDNSYTSFSGDNIVFGQKGGDYIVAAHAGVDTVAHEFTHTVVQNETDLDLNYSNAPGAINEAYADIFGYFAEGDDDPAWTHGEDNRAQPLRVLSDPNSKGMPTGVGGVYYYDFTIVGNTYDKGGVHTNNSVISYPCYLMWKNGISDKARLATLWYLSLKYGYDANASFEDVRLNVLRAAKAMSMSGQEIQIIKTAFDTAGIRDSSATMIEGTNVLFGKVVAADGDMIVGNNAPLPSANITLTRQGTSIPIQAISEKDGTFKFYDLYPGIYMLSASKVGYMPVKLVVKMPSVHMTNYCNTIELIPQTYSGSGIAKGVVKDSVTGSGVGGLTLNVRRGMNITTGETICRTITGNLGEYELKLDAGHYCVQVVDERILEEGQKKYYTTYFNIKVLGGMTIANQNATVSTELNEEQIRIVLEWGAAPSDLDSHLIGPASGGGTFHVWYRDKAYSDTNGIVADLDIDDTSSYGPETTTIYHPVQGEYTFYVHNFSGSPDIKISDATVKVFSGNNNEPAYVFAIPLVGNGKIWTVFKYDSRTRRVKPINVVGDSVAK